MVVLIHVMLALISIGQTTFLLFMPSKTKLYSTYALFGGTLLSGTYLILTKPVHMLTMCVEGVAYVAFVVWGIVFAYRKLAQKTATD